MFFPAIIHRGVGSRLWPLSREAHPKLFTPLPGRQSLIVAGTPDRLLLAHRSVRWTVTRRMAKIGNRKQKISLNNSTYKFIPACHMHRLELLT
ncbi:mannose-1-phosphate guanylyltransferase/mannose-6-phosphate isomerase [compost metagenome]